MNVSFSCPACERPARVEFGQDDTAIICPFCQRRIEIAPDALVNGRVQRCLTCSGGDLFLRKDFPQRVGVGLVALGIVASSVAWGFGRPMLTYGFLFGTALADVVLYLIVPNSLACYRCDAQYRDLEGINEYSAFNLEIHERYRQQAARMASPRR